MAAALIDRLLHHCHLVNIRGNSYRMREHTDLYRALQSDVEHPPNQSDRPANPGPQTRSEGDHVRSFGPPESERFTSGVDTELPAGRRSSPAATGRLRSDRIDSRQCNGELMLAQVMARATQPSELLMCLGRQNPNRILTTHDSRRAIGGGLHQGLSEAIAGDLRPCRGKREPARIGELLRAIDGYTGHTVTAYALKLAPLLFVRPDELRHAEWTDFDLDGREPQWRIPAEKMKMGEQHLVPLSKQALALLRELQPVTERGPYVFPSLRSRSRPMSDNTVNAALRRLGYTSEEMTGHGFRSLASTCLNEQGYHPDLIELQLAHAERNKVRAAYNKAQRLPERRKMMQAWADYLDQLRLSSSNTNVVPLLAGARAARAVRA